MKRKRQTEIESNKCEVCNNGKISCAEGDRIGYKTCVFCGGTGLKKETA